MIWLEIKLFVIKKLKIITFLCYSYREFLADLLSNFVGKEILFYEKSPISTVLFAILIGIVVGNFIKIARSKPIPVPSLSIELTKKSQKELNKKRVA